MTRNIALPLVTALLAGGLGACSESPTAPPPAPECGYTVSALSVAVPSGGGAGSVTVTTVAACAWTASTTTAWLAITAGASGTGPGTVTVTAQPNPTTSARTGTMLVAGTTVTVQQAGLDACTFAISPTRATFEKDGGTGSIGVSAASHCAWQATTTTAWIAITTGASGAGTGTIGYRVDPNRSPLARTGTVTAAGHTFTVEQAADVGSCTYQVSPVQLSICMAWSFDLTSTVTTQDGCPWTAASTVGWMSVIDGASGTGSGTVRLRGTDNYDARRTGLIQVRWPTVTAGQNLLVDQAGCLYAVTQSSFTFAAAGGTGRFDVLQQSDPMTCGGPLQSACVWSAVSNASWITVTSSMPRTGDEPVTFTVAPNVSGVERTGTITVRDKKVTIVQSAM